MTKFILLKIRFPTTTLATFKQQNVLRICSIAGADPGVLEGGLRNLWGGDILQACKVS